MNEDYGRIIPVEGGAEPIDPSLRYRVVFAVTKPIGDGGAPHHDLVRVARFLTLLADAGVSIEADDVLAIVSGPATSIVTLGDAVNRPLIEQLVARGATIAVCRPEARRVGKESVSTCRVWWSRNHIKKKHYIYTK